MKRARTSFLFRTAALAALLVGACATPRDLPPAGVPRGAETIASTQSLSTTLPAAWPDRDLWRMGGDAQLAALIAEGLQSSPDMVAALARLRAAEGMAQVAGAPLLPGAGLQGAATLDKQSYNNGFPKAFVPQGWNDRGRLAAALGWDIDLWGRNRAGLAAAVSERRAAEHEISQARLLLISAIALAYADLERLFAERDVRQATVTMRETGARLVAQRLRAGLDMRGSLRLAESQSATARADLAATEEALLLRRHQIAALIGAGPDRGLAIARPQLPPPVLREVPADASTALVAHRPDIAMARERVEAEASRVKAARADFYPAIRLDALAGFQSLGLDLLMKRDSLAGNVGPAISLPLFQGGALQGRYRVARSRFDAAVADYDRTVIAAYQQVADALASRRAAAERLAEARAALTAAEDAHALARKRYAAGLSTYLDVLAVEDRLLQARLGASSLEAVNRSAAVALVRALGGGFSIDSAPDAGNPQP
mgnify:CR=1 FL=1